MPQSLACIHVHLIFSTHGRLPLLHDDFRAELHAYMATSLKGVGSTPHLINSVDDHVHALFELGRTASVAQAVEAAKSSSSKWLKKQGRGMSRFAWQKGYAAFSVSESRLVRVEEYIASQREHHRKHTFQQEVVGFLKRHRVEYDERYLWD